MIPSFDGSDRQYERRVRLFVCNTQVAPEELVDFWRRREGRACDSCEGIQDWDTPNGVENLLDHLRIHFEPIEAFRQGRVVDDFVCDFERQSGEKIKEDEPPRDAHGDSSSSRFAMGSSVASQTVRSVLGPSGRGPG